MRVQFGDFTFDDDRRQLQRGDEDIHLSPKEFELLRLLIADRPNALSKAALHCELWPDTFVSEVSLAALVARLRSALKEPGRGGQFIRTIHGFGYAFVAETSDPSGAVVAACWLTWNSQRIPISEGTNVIGRSSDAQIPIESELVSRRHAALYVTQAEVTIEDLRSKNGTWVRGERLTGPVSLEDGDEILIGRERLTFHNLLTPGRTHSSPGFLPITARGKNA
jgi:DNA-binding winged helix-turn-helix (wHTH) protein